MSCDLWQNDALGARSPSGHMIFLTQKVNNPIDMGRGGLYKPRYIVRERSGKDLCERVEKKEERGAGKAVSYR